VANFYTIDAANARIPEVRELLLLLRDQRDELVRLRDRLLELRVEEAADAAMDDPSPDDGPADDRRVVEVIEVIEPPGRPTNGEALTNGTAGEAARIRLKIQGVVDQMQASVARIDGWGITLRDIDSGLIDFPALVTGRQVWLCWRLGEGDVDWWHELMVGFSGRKRLSELA
jgi:hypothetical protein